MDDDDDDEFFFHKVEGKASPKLIGWWFFFPSLVDPLLHWLSLHVGSGLLLLSEDESLLIQKIIASNYCFLLPLCN